MEEEKIIHKSFDESNFTGIGILITDKYKYEGEFINGSINGKGKKTFFDDTYYEGSFKYGKYHGFGILASKDFKQEGYFENGLMEGEGIIKIKNTTVNANFYNGKLHGDVVVKDGLKIETKIYKFGNYVSTKGHTYNMFLYSDFKMFDKVGIYSLDHENNVLFSKVLHLDSKENLNELKRYLDEARFLTILEKDYFTENINNLFKINNIIFDFNKFDKYSITDISDKVIYYFERSHKENPPIYINEDFYYDFFYEDCRSIITIYEEIFKKKTEEILKDDYAYKAKLLFLCKNKLNDIYKSLDDDDREAEVEWYANGGGWR